MADETVKPAAAGAPPPSGRIQEVNGFQIIGKIGQGAMGAVYKARQISLDRIVALKILPPSIAKDVKFIERFQREARASARLNHPHIVQGIDVGKDPVSGLWYFAMEFVEGASLKDLLKKDGKVPEQRALKLVREVAQALECVDANKMVHRDIKPDNILLTQRGESKLADLGLAKQTNDTDASLTQAGNAVGTPYYMAPEQCRGEGDSLDIRCDIYALGATLFHLVIGEPPFTGATGAAIMVKHLTEAPPKANKVNPAVSEACGKLIEKMMQKKKEQRVQSPAQLILDIDKILQGKAEGESGTRPAIRTTGPRTPVSARMPRERSATGSGALNNVIAIVLFVVVAGGVAYLAGRKKPDPEPLKTVAAVTPEPVPIPVPVPVKKKSDVPTPVASIAKKTPDDPPVLPATSEAVKPVPETAAVEVPVPIKPTETALPKPETEPLVVPVVVKPVEPAKPAGPDPEVLLARAKFLIEMQRRARSFDLTRVEKEMRDLASGKEYAPAKALIETDLKDLENAIRFEVSGLEVLGKGKGTLDLPENHALRKMGADKVKIEKYEPGKGLFVKAGSASTSLPTRDLPPKTIVDAAPPAADSGALNYFLIRGAMAEAQKLIPIIPEAERARFEEKINLIKIGDVELSARAAYVSIAALTKPSQAKILLEKIAAFEKQYRDTQFAQLKAAELAASREFAEDALNPLRGVFHASVTKILPNGFVELFYDFTTDEQLKDFGCEHGKLSIEKGWIKVPKGGEEFSQARLLAPLLEIKKLHVTGKTLMPLGGDGSDRLGIYFLLPGTVDGNKTPRLLCRIYNKMPHLEYFTGTPIIGTTALDWSTDVLFQAEGANGELNWTVNGTKLGKVILPDKAIGGNIALIAVDGNHVWKELRLVVKPDPAWVQKQKGN